MYADKQVLEKPIPNSFGSLTFKCPYNTFYVYNEH